MGSKVSKPSAKDEHRSRSPRQPRNTRHGQSNYQNYAYSHRTRNECRPKYQAGTRIAAPVTRNRRLARRDFLEAIPPVHLPDDSRRDYVAFGGVEYVDQGGDDRSRRQPVEQIIRGRRNEWDVYKKNMMQTVGGRFYF